MGDALAVFDNTLDLGDMEFVHGQFKYSMRANRKLLVENSMDGYHANHTHERFFSHWLESEGLGAARAAAGCGGAERRVQRTARHRTARQRPRDDFLPERRRPDGGQSGLSRK